MKEKKKRVYSSNPGSLEGRKYQNYNYRIHQVILATDWQT
jgi:hypothetical protein